VSSLRRAFARLRREEEGLTLVELLVASTLSIVLLAGISSMVIGTMKAQPQISERAQDVSSSRWVLERLTKEIRNGIRIDAATPSSVSFVTYVRSTICGGGVQTSPTTPAIKCQVTYQCTTTSCTRSEAAEGKAGIPKTVFTGINSSSVFCYVPSKEADPLTCGEARSLKETTYIGVRLRMSKPGGGATALTVSDGASLRNATLLK
jgi:Tfp pilus assembly protein PilW